MKKSRITKLALSGAAVAALAATFSTSTYAWYVSNKTATVSSVTGATSASAGDGSIALSTDGVVNHYYKTIALTAAANYNGVDTSIKLSPVMTTNGNTFTKDDGSTPDSTAYYMMTFYVKAESACTIRPTITVTNNTTTVPTQINYSTAASNPVTGSAGQGQDFTIDAGLSMYISQFAEIGNAYTTGENPVTTYSAASSQTGAITGQCSAVNGGANVTFTKSAAIDAYARKATGGAHAYYTEIQGSAPTNQTPYGELQATVAIGDITLAANTPQKLTYYIWLDGEDDQCFNSCVSQDFTFAFSYTVTAE